MRCDCIIFCSFEWMGWVRLIYVYGMTEKYEIRLHHPLYLLIDLFIEIYGNVHVCILCIVIAMFWTSNNSIGKYFGHVSMCFLCATIKLLLQTITNEKTGFMDIIVFTYDIFVCMGWQAVIVLCPSLNYINDNQRFFSRIKISPTKHPSIVTSPLQFPGIAVLSTQNASDSSHPSSASLNLCLCKHWHIQIPKRKTMTSDAVW